MPLLLQHAAQLLTLAGAPRARRGAEMAALGVVTDGAVICAGGRIVWAGASAEAERHLPPGEVEVRDCRGLLVTPGLVDSHTHLVFAAPRLADYERRLAGASYGQIAAAGGGITSSVAAVRAASGATLAAEAAHWLRLMRAHGATTVEVKSGYGLDAASEGKLLAAAASAAAATGQDVARTFLGAHVVPRGVDRGDYVRSVVEEMLPQLAPEAEFADVFCDPAGFSLAESRQVLMAAQARGLKLKVHAEQFAHVGGIGLGIELGAVSVDHLDFATEADAQLLGRAATVATLIPGANLFLGQPYPDARRLIGAGAAVALATDFNPGTCPIASLPLVMSVACSGMRLSPAEAWCAATINGAAALARAGECGSIEPGKRADLAIFAADDYRAVPYYAGQRLCRAVVQNGDWMDQPTCD
ncbi:MAG: imidazolonepropionase [Terriglobales bacterium]